MTPCTTHHCTGSAEYCHDCLMATLDTGTECWRDERSEREGLRALLRYLHLHCMLTTEQLSRITRLDRAALRALMDYDREAGSHDP